ncbi:hypothetical protein [Nocardia sp. NPDC047654]|uniref:hypothetical protein n=1 Tax=Nocardia sp. NPDC047654 TaxID=3364314 RepID=UPI00371062F2
MVQGDRNFHRRERIAAIAEWSKAGVQQPRRPLPIERAFAERVAQMNRPLFRPLELPNVGGVEYHRQVSYLVDAYDSIPARVDIAFDSVWKAFEAATKRAASGNVTDRLKKLAAGSGLDSGILSLLLADIPAQSCEYLFKRLVIDFGSLVDPEERHRHQPNRRLAGVGDQDFATLLSVLQTRYGSNGDHADHRKGAMLLRRALSGEKVDLQGVDVTLSLPVRSAVLLSGLLYTARNDRFHGESFSPFVSSAATIRTYTHPYFLFLASYSLLSSLWLGSGPCGVGLQRDDVVANISANLEAAHDLFGRHWLG